MKLSGINPSFCWIYQSKKRYKIEGFLIAGGSIKAGCGIEAGDSIKAGWGVSMERAFRPDGALRPEAKAGEALRLDGGIEGWRALRLVLVEYLLVLK